MNGELLADITNSILPVFAIIGLGAFLRRIGLLTEESLSGLSGLVYWVGLPCLLFQKIATTTFQGREASPIFLTVISTMLVIIAVGYATSFALRLPNRQRGTFAQAGFRGNLAFVGLPVLLYTSSSLPPEVAHDFERLAVFAIAPIVPVYNACAILTLVVGQRAINRQQVRRIISQIVLNPLLQASILGSILSLLAFKLPTILDRTTQAVGQMSLPLALITIGGSLLTPATGKNLKTAGAAALLKVAATPLLGHVIGSALGLAATEMRIAMTLMACPTAAACYILAAQMGGDKELAAGAVVISTLLSLVSLTLATTLY